MDEFMTVKRRLFQILEVSEPGDNTSKAYDSMMVLVVMIGLVPLTIKHQNIYTELIDIITVSICAIDYILRLYTSDYKMGIKSYKAYIANAIMPVSIIDLLAVLPIIALLFPDSATIGMLRLFRIALLMKIVRYSPSLAIIFDIIKKAWRPLSAVFILAFVYIVSCAIIIFQVEPDTFRTFLDAIYWSGCTVLTVGYGDITPLTETGRALSVISALVGVAVIALPSGIVTAAYMEELKSKGHM